MLSAAAAGGSRTWSLVVVLSLAMQQWPAAMSHSSLIIPPPRNAVDKVLAPWRDGGFGGSLKYGSPPDNFGCTCVNATAQGAVPCEVAQSCFWFSNGCSIGCTSCDGGLSSGTNPNTKDRCPGTSGNKTATLNPAFRTINNNATPGSTEDLYRFNPWRAPGRAPTYDSCGMAGGRPTVGGGEGKYFPTKFAKQGALGSKVLPPAPSGTMWTAGGTAVTGISIRANHGGGYAFRLCPAGSALTEECFRARPLSFVPGKQALRLANGTEIAIEGSYTTEGTYPVNSSWARNPLPNRVCTNSTEPSSCSDPSAFPPPCQEDVGKMGNAGMFCSGGGPGQRVMVLDTLHIPADTPPGEYVLGFRWDCEISAQIWAACADVTIA